MELFANIPKIYRGPIYLILALNWWLLGRLVILNSPRGISGCDVGPGLLIGLIFFLILLIILLFGVIYTIQGINGKLKKKKNKIVKK